MTLAGAVGRACKIDFREADIAKQTRSRSGLGEAC
jgi:hypothetical protein